MTGQTQNTGPARIKSLFAAAIAVVMLGAGMSAGYAIASLGQDPQVAAPAEAKAQAPSRTRGQVEDADPVAMAADRPHPASDRRQAAAATKTVAKDSCTGARTAQPSACTLVKMGV